MCVVRRPDCAILSEHNQHSETSWLQIWEEGGQAESWTKQELKVNENIPPFSYLNVEISNVKDMHAIWSSSTFLKDIEWQRLDIKEKEFKMFQIEILSFPLSFLLKSGLERAIYCISFV